MTARPAALQTPSLAGARVLVLGLGRFGGGLGAARWLLQQGAQVTVTDKLTAEALPEPCRVLTEAGARLVLGGHEGLDPTQFDLLVVNPAVPQSAPLVVAARAAGVRVSSEMALLLERWPGPVLGVTGSNGKSTTVTLAAAVLGAMGRDARAGGNLGGSLLPDLTSADARTVAVVELSSFMLEVTGPLGLGPDVAVVTNITPNHLDRHGSLAAYVEAKAAVLVRAHSAVLPSENALARDLLLPAGCSRLLFGAAGPEVPLGVDGAGHLVDSQGARVLNSSELAFPGRVARLDLAAATLAARAVTGQDPLPGLASAARSWRPPPHRLAPAGERAGVRYVDDSVSTTPESTAASLEAVGGPCVLLAGGRDKGLCSAALVAACQVLPVRLVLTLGEQAEPLAAALSAAGVPVRVARTLEIALPIAHQVARPGDTVLLSPGYSSHDQFINYEARGRVFCERVAALPRALAVPLSPPAAEC